MDSVKMSICQSELAYTKYLGQRSCSLEIHTHTHLAVALEWSLNKTAHNINF